MKQENNSISLLGTLTGHQNPIFALTTSAINPNRLFTGGNDKGVVEWDLESMSFNRILCKVGSSVYSLLAIPGTSLLAIGMRSGQILIVDTETQMLKANLKTEKGSVFSIKIIPHKNEIIAIGEEGVAYVWSLIDFNLLYRFKVSDTTVRVIEVQDSGEFIAFGDKNGFIYLNNLSDFQSFAKKKIHELPVTSLYFEKGGSIFSGGRDAKLYQLDMGLNIQKELTPHMFTVYGIAPNEDKNLFATASRDKTIKIWRKEDFGLVRNISRDRGYDSHYLSINGLIWENNKIITVSDDKTIKVWQEALEF